MVVKSIPDYSKKRRVVIFKRDDGSFGFRDGYYSEGPDEMSWVPNGRYYESYGDSAETAESEARGRVEWLADA